jgi:hypothetical protein
MRSEPRVTRAGSDHVADPSVGRRKKTSRRVLVLLAALGLGCDVYDPAFLVRLDAGPRIDGGGDAGDRDAGRNDGGEPDGEVDAGTDAGPVACGRPIPSRPTSGDGDGPELVFAFKDVIVDQTADPLWHEIGFNLDGECTNPGITEYLCAPLGAAGPPLDGPDGVDNIVGERIFPQIAMFDPDFQTGSAEGMERGSTFLIRIRGWNGEPNDPRVEAVFAQGIGREGFRREDGQLMPQWDGLDEFDVSRANFSAGNPNAPIVADDNAYVAGNRLVFRLPDRENIRLPFDGPNDLIIRLAGAFLTGVITAPGENGFRRMENTVLTGRWSALDISDAVDGVGICATTPERIAFDSLIGNQVDIRSDGSTTGMLRCDALSVAVGFTGYTAIWGNVVTPPDEPPDPCE